MSAYSAYAAKAAYNAANGNSSNGVANKNPSYTPTAMSRWSILNTQLPAADTIRHLHIYDFDNTRMSILLSARHPVAPCARVPHPKKNSDTASREVATITPSGGIIALLPS